jgi:hypothetical protein
MQLLNVIKLIIYIDYFVFLTYITFIITCYARMTQKIIFNTMKNEKYIYYKIYW